MTEPVPRVTVVVLTFNEARNLPACLGALAGWTVDTFVVDSGSTDDTIDIATAHGARVEHHRFETHARQWAWALGQLPIRTNWVLGIDADQRVTPELRQSIDALAARPWRAGEASGYFVNRRQIFRGRWIRFGGYYPKYLLKLFRRETVRVNEGELVDHHFEVTGPTGRLIGDLIEDNRNEASIADWIAKHNRYAVLQALQESRETGTEPASGRPDGDNPDRQVRRRKRLWRSLPLLLRPVIYFAYRYVFRFGFLDGREGLIFHFMQALWYRLLVDINILELRERAAEPAPGHARSTGPAAGTGPAL